MAVDREALTNDILKQGQKPLYSFVTPTIEQGKFAGLDYQWSKSSRESQNITKNYSNNKVSFKVTNCDLKDS